MRVLSWGGRVSPKFSARHSGKTMPCIRPPKVFEVQERARGSLSPCQVWLGSDFTRRRVAKNVFCLSVCPSRYWTSEFVRTISPWRRWSRPTETTLMPLHRGRFVVVHLLFNFLRLLPTGDTIKCRSPKRQHLGFFVARGRQNKPIETKCGT